MNNKDSTILQKVATAKDWAWLQIRKGLWLLRYKVLPKLVVALKLTLNGAYIALLVIIVVKSLNAELTDSYKELLSAMAGICGTVVAIFFSLVLIPLNEISAKYSPRFFRNLRNDQTFVITFMYGALCVVYASGLLITGSNQGLALSALLALMYLFFLLFILWQHSIFMANPKNSILDPEHRRIVKSFKKQIPKHRKALQRSLKKLRDSQSDENKIDLTLSKVDDTVIKDIKDGLLPMREIAMKAIKSGELEQARNAIGTMASVVLNYLIARKKYYSDDDPLMYFLYTELKLLMKTSNNELKLQLHPFLVDCWRNVGVLSAGVNIKGLPRMNNNVNNLTQYPTQALVDLCTENFTEGDSTAPGDACRAMADVGVALMKDGYEQSAMHIVEKLGQVSKLFEAANIGVFSGSANFAIMRIYAAGLAYRNSATLDGHDYTFRKIDEVIKDLLNTFLARRRNTFDTMILNPFIGSLTDPFNGMNLARTTEYALFSDRLSERSLEMNIKAVGRNVDSLILAIRRLKTNSDGYFGGQALENLYLTVMDLLSYIDPEMATDHILYMQDEPAKSVELKVDVIAEINKALDFMLEMAASDNNDFMPSSNFMDIVISIYLVLLYERRKTGNSDINSVYLRYHQALVAFLDRHTQNSTTNTNTSTTKYFRLLKEILRQNRYYVRANELNVPDWQYRSSGGFYFESEYPEATVGRHWSITRPIFQKNGYYWNLLEKELGLRDD